MEFIIITFHSVAVVGIGFMCKSRRTSFQNQPEFYFNSNGIGINWLIYA